VETINSFINDLNDDEEDDEDIANDLDRQFNKDSKFKPLF